MMQDQRVSNSMVHCGGTLSDHVECVMLSEVIPPEPREPTPPPREPTPPPPTPPPPDIPEDSDDDDDVCVQL